MRSEVVAVVSGDAVLVVRVAANRHNWLQFVRCYRELNAFFLYSGFHIGVEEREARPVVDAFNQIQHSIVGETIVR